MDRAVLINWPPKRIVSLVPSQTELLAYLRLDTEIVGITKFCHLPKGWFRDKPKVGGTKRVHIDKLHDLKPDLIIGNKEENDKETIELLMEHFSVWMSDVQNLDDATAMIQSLGEISYRSRKLRELGL